MIYETLMTDDNERLAYINSQPTLNRNIPCPQCGTPTNAAEMRDTGEVCTKCFPLVYSDL